MLVSEIVIIGAGVIGSSIAYRLSQAGFSVTVIDSASPGAGASGACDQAIFLQSKRPGLHMRLALESRRMFDTLEDELDSPLEFSSSGGMIAIANDNQLEFMSGFVEQQQEAGIEVELLDTDEARVAQPLLADSIAGASHSPLDAEINPLLLNVGFLSAAQRLGATVLRGVEMISALHSHDRIVGIKTTMGDICSNFVINASGPFAGTVGRRAGVDTPVEPRRGTILITEPVERQINGILLSAQYVAAKHMTTEPGAQSQYGIGLSLGQSASGNLLIGGSREFVGFSATVSSAIIEGIARHAVNIVPSLGRHRILRVMKGFRPYTGDGLPIIEQTFPGWITAAGHEGDGIALAPITGQLVADLISEAGPTHHFLESLRQTRTTLVQNEHEQTATGSARTTETALRRTEREFFSTSRKDFP